MSITINQSQLKAWRQCQRAWSYRYEQRLVPKLRDRPMHIGTWGHACLEAYYREGDWRIGHQPFVEQYESLFDEERELLDKGKEPLPRQIERIMESYLYYYADDGWTIVAVEELFEITMLFESGPATFKGRIDLIIEDSDGRRWVVDHKWPGNIPPQDAYHSMDPQLILYPWAVEQALGIKTEGVIFNYVRARAPSIPQVNKDGSVSKRKIATDHPTLLGFLQERGLDPDDYSDILEPLRTRSDFLARYRLPRSVPVTDRILYEAERTTAEIVAHTDTTRNVTRDCARCQYMALCRAELFGLDTDQMRQRDYRLETADDGSSAYVDYDLDDDVVEL